jgi:GAF domain-containing protein
VFERGQASLLGDPEQVEEAMADMRPANLSIFQRSLQRSGRPLCTLAAPIAVGSEKYGVLVLETIDGPEVFSAADIPFVQTLADLIGLAIDRARLQARADAIRQAEETWPTRGS